MTTHSNRPPVGTLEREKTIPFIQVNIQSHRDSLGSVEYALRAI